MKSIRDFQNFDRYRMLFYLVVFILIGITPGVFYSKTLDPFELPKFLFIRLIVCIPLVFALFYKKNQTVNYSRLLLYIWLFGLSITISTVLSEYREISFYGEWERYLGLTSLLPIVLSTIPLLFIDRKKLSIIKYAIFLGLVLVVIKGFRQITGYDIFSLERLGGRVISSLGNADFLGEYLVMTMPIVMLEVIYSKNKLERTLLLILFGFSFYILLASGTRSSWFTFLLILFLMPVTFLKPKTPYLIYKKVIFYLIFTGGLILMLLYLPVMSNIKQVLFIFLIIWLYLYLRYLSPHIIETLNSYKRRVIALILVILVIYTIFPYTDKIIPHKGTILTETIKMRLKAMTEPEMGRLYMLKASFNYIKGEVIKNPIRLLFGCGIDTTGKYLSRYKVIESARMDSIDSVIYADRAHNEYMDIFLQLGLVGFILFIILLFYTIKAGIKIHRSRHPFRIFTAGLILGIIGFAINGVFIFGISVTYLYLFLMTGIIGVIGSKRLKLANINKRGIYSILLIFSLVFSLYSSYFGIKQMKAHYFLLDGINAMNRGDLINAERSLDASIENYPIGFAFQKKLELYSAKLKNERKKEIFESGEKLISDIIRHVKYPTSAYFSIAIFYLNGYELGLDKSYLNKAVENLERCLEYDKYYKPALRVMSIISLYYMNNPNLAYSYAKRFVDIEQRDIEIWRILMRTAKVVKDWDTVWFSAKAIYLATEGKDKEAESYLKEAEKFISPSKNP